jgi:hypothetical protein
MNNKWFSVQDSVINVRGMLPDFPKTFKDRRKYSKIPNACMDDAIQHGKPFDNYLFYKIITEKQLFIYFKFVNIFVNLSLV